MDVSTPASPGTPMFEEGLDLSILASLSNSKKREPETKRTKMQAERTDMRQDLKDVLAKCAEFKIEGLYYDAKDFEQTKPFYDFLFEDVDKNLQAFPRSAFHEASDGPRKFNFTGGVETVDMKMLESCFDARISVSYWYKPTYSEIRMALKDGNFGTRPKLSFVNAISDFSAVASEWDNTIAYFPRYGTWIKKETLMAVQQTFQETFELHSFPFDVQDLCIKMRGERVQTCHLVPDIMAPKPFRLSVSLFSETDWVYESAMLEFFNDAGQAEVHIHIKVSRRWQHYFYRIYSILTLCALSGVLTFLFEMSDDFTDAVGYMSTCVLTVVAFMFVVSSTLPPIPYLTYLDALVFITLAFVFMLLLVLALFKVEGLGLSESGVLTGSIITWVAIQLIFLVGGVYLKKKEKKKLTMGTRELNELFEEKKDDWISKEDCRVVEYKPDSLRM